MKYNKLKVLWFGVVPIGWFLAFKLVEWVQFYPFDCKEASGLCFFLIVTGFFGSCLLILGSVGLAFHLQD